MPVPGKGYQSQSSGKVKHLYQIAETPAGGQTMLVPFFCVEARIDFNDVRTGFRDTVSLSRALEIYSINADLLWTDDMIREIDLLRTSSSAPEGVLLGTLPDFVDAGFIGRMENQFIQYLLRSFAIRIFRNFDLKLYSFSGESRPDFLRRCREIFDEPKRQELDGLHEVFKRRLAQTRQKYLASIDVADIEEAKSESENKDTFSRCTERISELFRKVELRMKPEEPARFSSGMHELEERLLSLETEAYHAATGLSGSFDEKAGRIDEYILHPNLKDIHFVRSCILWMSKGAA